MFEKDNRDNLLGSLEDFMIKDDKTGPALGPELVKVMNTNFLFRPSEQIAKPLCKKNHRPEHCPNMVVPRINEEIWAFLQKKSQSMDCKIQKAQSIVLKAVTPACHLLDKLISTRKSSKLSTDCLEFAQDIVILIQLAFTDLSYKRRYHILPKLKTLVQTLV